ncbi:cytoplasmic tRNA 2-thiolation protein 2-like isoform X4 [Myxocyprinus asiaticus]|uniref:cytoplasmic tRNA 2-thiolation protein 2-like isoform X4 n=1 Tax=Myxocyprinus asiaticus TaxID=70543 RepID=UPI0022225484|nr:cytoplasmic tRNA 2-thiolation protein 2-like isoform X4 [Myxocyprinus asiaticus]
MKDYNRLECNQKIHLLASCFKEYLIHKFRAMPGKNRVIFPQEKVLLAGSGGANSCLMLSQVQEVRCIVGYSILHTLGEVGHLGFQSAQLCTGSWEL